MISFRLQCKYWHDDANWDISYFITTLVCFKAAAHLSNKITGNKSILCVPFQTQDSAVPHGSGLA